MWFGWGGEDEDLDFSCFLKGKKKEHSLHIFTPKQFSLQKRNRKKTQLNPNCYPVSFSFSFFIRICGIIKPNINGSDFDFKFFHLFSREKHKNNEKKINLHSQVSNKFQEYYSNNSHNLECWLIACTVSLTEHQNWQVGKQTWQHTPVILVSQSARKYFELSKILLYLPTEISIIEYFKCVLKNKK